ncbi:MAG: hypothetical protein KDB03_04235 [Planctomycetales bacterium]|nr:hypothetical protein [Planctomycetales bacterium]
MRKILTILAVACACVGVSPLHAQVQILGSYGQPTLAPRLVANQNLLGEDSATAESSAIANPFDYLSPSADSAASSTFGGTGLSEPSLVQPRIRPLEPLIPDAPVVTESPSDRQLTNDSADDFQKRPIDSRAVNQGQVGVSTPYALDANVGTSFVPTVPNAGFAPAQWCQPTAGYNPVATYMLRQWCVDGLWDNYPCERAALCADMHGHLTKKSACSTCAPGIACNSCQPINRYTQPTHGCSTCQNGNTCQLSAPALVQGPPTFHSTWAGLLPSTQTPAAAPRYAVPPAVPTPARVASYQQFQ